MSVRRVLIGAIGVSGAAAVALLTTGHRVDFGFDWVATRAFVSGIDPYQPFDQLAPQVGSSAPLFSFYPPRTPAVLLIQAPIGWVPIDYAYVVGRLLTVASFAWFAWVIGKLSRLPVHWCLAAMPLLLFVRPFSDVLAVSQTSYLVAALIGISWFIARRNDSFLAGVPLAGAIAFKLWPWLLVPAFWLGGFRKTAASTVLVFASFNFAGLLFPHLSLSSAVTALLSVRSEETWSLVGRLGVPVWVGVVIGLLSVFALSRVVSNEALVMSSIGVALLVAPILWPHYLVVLLVPAAHLLAERQARSDHDGRAVTTGQGLRTAGA